MDRVTALRNTWRKSAEHFAEQLYRLIRLTVLALIPSVLDWINGGHYDKKLLFALLIPAFEVAYRQVFPALGAEKADAAPGTITTVGDPEPVQTDNGPTLEDGDQSDVIQDPNYIPPVTEVEDFPGGEATDASDLS